MSSLLSVAQSQSVMVSHRFGRTHAGDPHRAGPTMKVLVTATLLLSCAAASAQEKHDIRGLYPGMTAAEAISSLKGLDCRLLDQLPDYEPAPACIYQRRDSLKNQGLYAFFAASLPDRPVWAVVLTFGSILNRDEIADAVAQQFHIRFGPNEIAKPGDTRTRIDVGRGLMLRLAPEQNSFVQGYRLSLWSEPLRAREDRAEVVAAIPKF
jgi:hypothetical protein